MLNKKKQITVKEIISKGLKSDEAGTPFYHEFAFLDYNSIKVGDKLELVFDKRLNKYGQMSLLFDYEYYMQNFKKNRIYNLKIVKDRKDFFVLKTDDNKYCKAFKNSLLREPFQYKIGDYIEATYFGTYFSEIDGQILKDKSFFVKDKIYNCTIHSINKNRIILKTVADNKYCNVMLYDLITKSTPYKTGEVVSVSIDYKGKFSTFQASFNLFKESVENASGSYLLKINQIEKIENIEKNTYAYNFYTTTGMKIFAIQSLNSLFEKNFNFLSTKIYEEDNIELRFKYSKEKEQFKFSIPMNLKNLTDDEKNGKLEYNEYENLNFIETKFGFAELNTWFMSYLDKSLLKLYQNKMISYSTFDDRFLNTKIVLKKYDFSFISSIQNKEYRDLKIVDFIDNNMDKRIYLIEFATGLYGFLEASEYSYHNTVGQIDEVIPKLQVKEVLNGSFIFLTRKPYLVDPKIEFFRERSIGDRMKAKVNKIYNAFIIVTLEGNFNFHIFKKDLKALEFFEIEEFYKIGEIYDFFISKKNPQVELVGYNVNEFYNSKLAVYKNDTLCSGRVYKQMVTKFVVRLSDNIEASLPIDEISHLDIDDLKFNNELDYKFKIINFKKSNNNYKITLSRKRLSHPIYSFKKKYPAGSIAYGNFFYRDETGFYFNLKHRGGEISELVGFLSNYEISNYPNVEDFSKKIINNEEIEFKIIAYPSKNIIKKGTIFEKAILLSIKNLSDFKIKSYYDSILDKDIFLKNEDIIEKNVFTFLNDNDRVYFKKSIAENYFVYSLKSEMFIPGFVADKKRSFTATYIEYTKKLLEISSDDKLSNDEKLLTSVLLNKSSDKRINYFSLKNLTKNYFNKINNTIEIGYSEFVLGQIKEKLGNTELKIIGKDEDGCSYGWFLNNDLFRIRVYLLNDELSIGEQYKINIVNYYENNNKLIGEISSLSETNIGKYYSVTVTGKIDKYEYSVQFLGNKQGIINSFNSELMIKEQFFAELSSIDNGKYIFSYNFDKQDVLKFPHYVAIDDLLSILSQKERIITLTKEDILSLYLILKEKYISTDKKGELNDINNMIYLLENGTKKGIFIIENRIFGQGQFGKVYKGINLIDKEKVVCKKFISNREDDIEGKRFKNEAKVLSELDKEGFVKLYHYYEQNSEYISSFADGITLREYIKNNINKSYDWKKENYINILIKISEILDDLHQDAITHCDIKPENIIFNEKEDSIYIIDLGSVQTEDIKGGFGTIFYSSPKQCSIFSNEDKHFTEEHDFGIKDDIYSLGIMMYEMLTGKLPYSDELEEEIIIYAHQYGQMEEGCEYSFILPSGINSNIESALEDIIVKCMHYNPCKRYEEFYDVIEALEEV